MMVWALVSLGLVALLALLGLMSILPPYVAFFVGSLGVILFPGIVIVSALAPREAQSLTLLEKLTVWFTTGIGVLAISGFVALLLGIRLSVLIYVLCGVYALLAVSLIGRRDLRDLIGSHVDATSMRASRSVSIVLLAIAVGAALLTLASARNGDDWYYLAYIRDFASDHALGSEDAIFGPDGLAASRTLYAGWWVVEALLSRATGTDPVGTHQVYLPLLIMPFVVFAIYLLARQVFQSERIALLAASLHVIFLLSSAHPPNNTGWMILARTAQDKTFSFAVMTPVAVALALIFMSRRRESHSGRDRGFYLLYCLSLLAAALVHPLGIVWCAIGIIPFAVLEYIRQRNRSGLLTLTLIMLPFMACGLYAASGSGQVTDYLETRRFPQLEAWKISSFFSPYLPGEEFRSSAEDMPAGSILRLSESLWITHPRYITRFPLAVCSLALSFLLLRYVKTSRSARFLAANTFTIIILAFVPGITDLAAKVITWKMAYRMSWILPWGLTMTFFLSRMRLRLVHTWIVVLLIAFAVARGDPRNYVKSLVASRAIGRPYPQAAAVLRALRTQPAPQGVILTSKKMDKLIAAYVPDGYPATYRTWGTTTHEIRKSLLALSELNESHIRQIRDTKCKYILLENFFSLNRALEQRKPLFYLVHTDSVYSLWKVISDVSP